jgi:hypothetical protein
VLREQLIPLPRAVIERAQQETDDPGLTSIVEHAFARILDGTPGDRMAFMQTALPLAADGAEVYSYPCVVRSEQFRRVDQLCQEKNLSPVVLVAGAIMVGLGMVAPPDTPPSGHRA